MTTTCLMRGKIRRGREEEIARKAKKGDIDQKYLRKSKRIPLSSIDRVTAVRGSDTCRVHYGRRTRGIEFGSEREVKRFCRKMRRLRGFGKSERAMTWVEAVRLPVAVLLYVCGIVALLSVFLWLMDSEGRGRGGRIPYYSAEWLVFFLFILIRFAGGWVVGGIFAGIVG